MPLAEFASSCGHDVWWFHPQGWSRHGIGEFSAQVVSQQHSGELWDSMQYVVSAVPHIPQRKVPHVMIWNPSVSAQCLGLKKYRPICFPCKSYSKLFRQQRTRNNIALCEWSFGAPERPSGKPSFVLVADPKSIDQNSMGLLYLLRRFHQLTSEWPILISWRCWPKTQYHTLLHWIDEGLTWIKDPTWAQRRNLLSNCKGLIDCSLSPAHGWSLQAAEWGVPVVAYDIEPATDWLRHDINSLLAACELETSGQHTWANPDIPALWQETTKWLARLEDLSDSLTQTFLQRRESFHDFWHDWFDDDQLRR